MANKPRTDREGNILEEADNSARYSKGNKKIPVFISIDKLGQFMEILRLN